MRVVVADDSALLREGVARLLEDAGFEVVGKASGVEDVLLKVRSYSPDIAILDIRMPPTQTDEGIQAAEAIFEAHPDVCVLLLSQAVEAKRAVGLFAKHPGGFGYLLKERVLDVDDFVDAVRRVARGGTAVDPEVVAQLVGRPRDEDPISELTEREREVLGLMAEGRSNQGIGQKLFLSPKTVEAHVHSIFTKLRLAPASEDHRRVLAVLAYLGRD
jgi:DNA-binding NarL/FixJ family response regulator